MQWTGSFWSSVTYVINILTLSPTEWATGRFQTPLLAHDGFNQNALEGPVFKPPTRRLDGPGSDFYCDYSAMKGFRNCSTFDNRGCWLRNDETGFEYNIEKNYEDLALTPIGITRRYRLDLAVDKSLNADGMNFAEGKVFNKTYPGPWIQACWGDVTVEVIVNNKLDFNGTSIHWHGIRQLNTMQMDGVNGITQCPIAPNDSFVYRFKVMQYGSSWYHSHFSVQYADGALGPLTFHGPSSASYDEAKTPILMTDWGHNSAFEAIQSTLKNATILLNGAGNITRYYNLTKSPLDVPKPYTLHFQRKPDKGRAKRYLLRIINTSFESTFVFSIDNHVLKVVGADFVPIKPYETNFLHVGIGQRYHVIVEADPKVPKGASVPENYWIRTYRASCFRFPNGSKDGYEETGIIRYGESEAEPDTKKWPVNLDCNDEPYDRMEPIVRWAIGKPANDPKGGVGENFTVLFDQAPTNFPLAKFSVGGDTFNPLQVNWGNPTFLNLANVGKWNPLWVVFPETYKPTDWVWLVLKGGGGNPSNAHPIHLHGHDFAILQTSTFPFPAGLAPKRDNPMRRDVVLLPANGYVIIAFKTDNPGAWIMHCHIAYHASFGLALQMMERRENATAMWPANGTVAAEIGRGCQRWNEWASNCSNWWTGPGTKSACGVGEDGFSPDSGI